MIMRNRVKRRQQYLSFEEWHKKLWRQFWSVMIPITLAWISAGLFTVWLLSGVRNG